MATITVAGVQIFDPAPSLQGAATTPTANNDVVLTRIASVAGTGSTAAGRSEVVAYESGQLFTTNAAANRIDVFRIDVNGAVTAQTGISLAGLPNNGGSNAVAVRNGVVAVAVQNSVADQPGYVALYNAATGALIRTVTVGVLPDQLVFTPDGQRLLVANEGEAISSTNNPAGSVSIISLAGGAAAATVTNTISFAGLNGSEAALRAQGLATFAGQSATSDIEPEYITISPDGTRAYVTLQEVNAVAVIDLTNPAADRPLSIQPLGFIDRSLAGNAFDPNDQNGVSIANFPVRSLPQPDAIASFSVGGATYFVTANEGDARVGAGLVDEARLSASTYVLDPAAFPNAAALKANAQLGRLNVITSLGDTDGDGDFDQIFTFGGRGISIFRQNADGTLTKVRETGGEFERIIAAFNPALHNVENDASPDNRSDNKGPEPEGVVVGMVNGRAYAFVTLERVGGVMIYDVTDPANASYVGFRPASAQDYGPETVIFVPAAQSPTGFDLVVSANEISGTTTIYAVNTQTSGADVLRGGLDGDSFRGRAGNDQINGGAGTDILLGDEGDDTIDGGADGDYILGGLGADRLLGGAGVDLLGGEDGADYLTGGEGGDNIFGAAANDLLFGEAGDDVISGGGGDDVLGGNGGGDRLTGDAGADRFLFFPTDAAFGSGAVITDFTTGVDRIDVSLIDANSGVAGDQAFTFRGITQAPGPAGTMHVGFIPGVGVFLFGYTDGDANADVIINIGTFNIAGTDIIL